MFEIYLKNTYELYQMAKLEQQEEISKMLFRACTFTLISSVESYVNYIATSFIDSQTLSKYEEAFLADKKIHFSNNEVVLKNEFYQLEDKLRFLIKKFSPNYDFNNRHWCGFKEMKTFRNSLVHPKEDEDSVSVTDYKSKIEKGLTDIIHVINHSNEAIYKKPIRRQLLDLIP